jgi:hypothetical protein
VSARTFFDEIFIAFGHSSARNIVGRSRIGFCWQRCHHSRSEGNLIMKFGNLSALSAAALLAGGISFAMAQSNPAPSGSSGSMATPQGQCWDAASNTIKDKSGSPSGSKTPGGVTTGSAPSGQNNNTKGTGNSSARPAAAANINIF